MKKPPLPAKKAPANAGAFLLAGLSGAGDWQKAPFLPPARRECGGTWPVSPAGIPASGSWSPPNPGAGKAALDSIEAAAKYPQIKGVKLHPISNLLKPYNPLCVAVMKKAAELDLPVFIHCGDKVAAQPWQIGLGAQECPDTTIICHMGGFFHGEEAIRMAKKNPNIYLDTSSIPYPHIIAKAIHELGAERIVFATDNPAGDPVSDLQKILNLNLDKQTQEQILWKNSAKILKLDKLGRV